MTDDRSIAVDSRTLERGAFLLIAILLVAFVVWLTRELAATRTEVRNLQVRIQLALQDPEARVRELGVAITAARARGDHEELSRMAKRLLADALAAEWGLGAGAPRAAISPGETLVESLLLLESPGLDAAVVLTEAADKPALVKVGLAVIAAAGEASAIPAIESVAQRSLQGAGDRELQAAVADAASAMVERGVLRARRLLIALATNRDFAARFKLARAMAQSKDMELLQVLIAALATDPDLSMRSHVAQALGAAPSEIASVDDALLRALVEDQSAHVRRNAAAALGQRALRFGASEVDAPRRARTLAALIAAVEAPPDGGVQATALRYAYLIDRTGGRDLARRHQDSPDEALRREAARILSGAEIEGEPPR